MNLLLLYIYIYIIFYLILSILQRLRVISEIMQECWHQNPNVRLPALRVMKTLRKLEDSETSENGIHHV